MLPLQHTQPPFYDGRVRHAWVYHTSAGVLGNWYVCRECGEYALQMKTFINLKSVDPSRADVLEKIAQHANEYLDPQLE